MQTTEEILKARGSTHGNFTDNAGVAQEIKIILRNSVNWDKLPAPFQEGLDMIAHKIARAVSGDFDFRDHYDDIAGYAKLISQRCSK